MREEASIVAVVDEAADAQRELAPLLTFAPLQLHACATAGEFFVAHRPDVVGCVVLNFDCLSIPALQLQSMLGASGCRWPVIFLVGAADVSACVAAMKAGAITVLTKPAEADQVRAAIGEAIRIDRFRRCEEQVWTALERRVQTLTPRERQVLEHVVAGLLNKQIAAVLGTTVKTIKVHRARVMQKMRVRSLAELVQVAVCMGLVHGLETAPSRDAPPSPDAAPYFVTMPKHIAIPRQAVVAFHVLNSSHG